MRRAGLVVYQVLARLESMIAPGVSTAELDRAAEQLTLDMGAEPLFKGVPGRGGPFPGTICASINEEVVHGIPSDERKLQSGEIISIDYGCRLDGYCGDAAATFPVGEVAPRCQKLLDVTRRSLEIAIETARPEMLWSQVARKMQQYVESNGFQLVREFVGHGIGKEMHEDPKVPNFVSRELLARDFVLREGVVIAVEPMVTMGSHEVMILRDGWTVVTVDGQPSAHFEHTLAVTGRGVQVLTQGG